MPRKVTPLPEWIPQACELMVKYDLSLRQAAAELGQDISVEEAEALRDRKLFKECLEEKRLAYYSEIGTNPKLTKDAIVGQLYRLAERLAADREDYKSADTLLKLAKVQGWVGDAEPDTLWKTFSKLNYAELEEVKKRLKEQRQPDAESKVEKSAERVN
jgi:hypothetical protein